MKPRLTPLFLVLLAAGLALASIAHAAVSFEPLRKWFSDGLFVSPRSANGPNNASNRLAALCQGTVTTDWGVIVDGACTAVTQDGGSSSVAIANCGATAIGSACIVSPSGTANDGGAQPWSPSLRYGCYVSSASGSTTTVSLRACKDVGDGGTVDPGPGPFRVVVLQ
jgi:hypothetical protein